MVTLMLGSIAILYVDQRILQKAYDEQWLRRAVYMDGKRRVNRDDLRMIKSLQKSGGIDNRMHSESLYGSLVGMNVLTCDFERLVDNGHNQLVAFFLCTLGRRSRNRKSTVASSTEDSAVQITWCWWCWKLWLQCLCLHGQCSKERW